MPKCPICGSNLLEVGWPDELGFRRYRCPNGCEFETPLSWKVSNAVKSIVVVLVLLLGLVMAIAISVVGRLRRRK